MSFGPDAHAVLGNVERTRVRVHRREMIPILQHTNAPHQQQQAGQVALAAEPPAAAASTQHDQERTIQEGDKLIVYESPNSMKLVVVSRKENFNNKFGAFQHKVRACAAGVPLAPKRSGSLLPHRHR